MKSRLFLSFPLALMLTACGGSLDQRYLDTSLGESLVLPPDLSETEVESRFELPTGFSGEDPSDRSQIPVLARVDTLQLENQSGLYWLSVEEPVDNLYQLVKNFWASEGYRLVIDEPVIGVMQTEWIYREEGGGKQDQSWWEKLLSGDDLSASQDQFRTRIERDESDNLSRIYIVHRGTEYVHVLERGDEYNTSSDTDENIEWAFRQPEPELEIEMLSRLMVYLGVEKSDVEKHLVNAKLFEPRASLHFDSDEQSPFIILNDAYHIAWNRVYHQLERMNFDIDAAEFSEGFQEQGYFIINTQVVESKEDGGFFSFGSDEPEKRQLVLVIYEENHEFTRLDIETIDGDYDTSPEGNEFLKLLYKNIK